MTKTLVGLVIFSFLNGIICASSGQHSYTADPSYFISTDLRSFIGAWLDCQAIGMQLATAVNEAEYTALNKSIIAAPQQSKMGYWIGAVAESLGTDSWYWLDLGQKVNNKTYWGTGQPNFDGNSERKQCVRVGNYYKTSEIYKWENVDCSLELPFVCKQN